MNRGGAALIRDNNLLEKLTKRGEATIGARGVFFLQCKLKKQPPTIRNNLNALLSKDGELFNTRRKNKF